MVGEVIAEQIRTEGHQVEVYDLSKAMPNDVSGDFLFIGSPTRMGKMTKDAKRFVENLNSDKWRGRPAATFDTVGPLSKDEEKRKKWMSRIDDGNKNAAAQLRLICSEQGLRVSPKLLHVAVTGWSGPLAPEGLDSAREFAHQFIETLKVPA